MDECDTIIVPQSDKTGRSVALEIIKPHVEESKIHMYYFPMTNDEAELDKRYSDLSKTVKTLLEQGKKCAYVTIGDTPLYSTFNYLAHKLRESGVQCELIPGIAAYSAAANRIGLSLTEKSESMCIVEMPDNTEKLDFYTENFETVVLMKVHKKLSVLIDYVNEKNISGAWLASRVCLDNEQITDLKTDNAPPDAGYLSTAILKR